MSSGARLYTVQSVYADAAAGQQQGQMGPGTGRPAQARGHQSGLQHVVSICFLACVFFLFSFF